MREFKFGDTFAVTFPNHAHLAGFVVARGDSGHPYLITYNTSISRHAYTGSEPLTQGDRFMCEGVPFKVDNDWALSVGEVTGKERSAIIPSGPARLG